MSEKPQNSPAIPNLKEWRAAREGTLAEWMEKNHDKIVRLPGFQSLHWSKDNSPFIIRIGTWNAAQQIRALLAVADIYEIVDECPVVTIEVIQ